MVSSSVMTDTTHVGSHLPINARRFQIWIGDSSAVLRLMQGDLG